MTITLPDELAPPTLCPHCSATIQMEGAFPICPNYHCSMRVYGRLQKFVDVLDIKGAGIETLREMALNGTAKTPADLFDVSEVEFCKIERKGEKHYKKFVEGLERVREMAVSQFFAALDIEGIGTWEAICAVPGLQTYDQIMAAALDPAPVQGKWLFEKAVRVSPEKATAIMQKIYGAEEDIRRLRRFVKFKVAGDKLQGKIFCITGSLSRPRPEIEKQIKDLGGQCASSVSSRVTHLVTNEPTMSTKRREAERKGIPIITEAQLQEMMS